MLKGVALGVNELKIQSIKLPLSDPNKLVHSTIV